MSTALIELIESHLEPLADEITKDAIRQIPSYGKAPIRQTLARMERLLAVTAESLRRNDPQGLVRYLGEVAAQRREQSYPIGELHALIEIAERHLHALAERLAADEVERNAWQALIAATMDAARMILSKNYLLLAQRTS